VREADHAVLDEAQLEEWGRRIGGEVSVPMVIALRGDLGAGKTTLARAVARGAGREGSIPSPTFNLVLRYDTARGIGIAHLDLYRLEREEEVWALGWSDLPGPAELVLIEWPERAESLLPEPRWEVELIEDDDPERRRVRTRAIGSPPPLPELPA
jgi:tRNA threonylcarbamoyladenosine biosynthesis protein TsaE